MTSQRPSRSTNRFEFPFKPNTMERNLAAAWRVVARDGLRGVNHEAIGDEVGRKLGTVGKISIARYLDHIIDYVFQPLIALSEGERFRSSTTLDRIASISAMLGKDRYFAAGVMQARAMAATARYQDRFSDRRAEAAVILINTLPMADALAEHAAAHTEILIRHYLEECGRVAGTA